jgi:alpha-N-arabinofuranosidase
VAASLRGERFARVSGRILTAEAMNAHNTFEQSDTVAPAGFEGGRLEEEQLTIELPPMSIVALELE